MDAQDKEKSSTVCTDPNVILPMMAKVLGLGPIPKSRWTPKWWHRLKKRRQMETAVSQWQPVEMVPEEVRQNMVKMQIAMELRDFAEMVLGYSHIDPERSAIVRNPRRVGKTRWLQHFKYEPPKPISERKQRRILRRTMREMDKKLEQVEISV